MPTLLPDEYPNSVPLDVAVSVCMTTYNHEGFIRQAIEGVLMQKTDFTFELCIGEDDSDDQTREICLEYAQKYPEKIRLFLRKDRDKIYIDGRKTGKYNGIRLRTDARGKYLASCEGDDFWIDSTKLQTQFDFMEAHPEFMMCATRCLYWHTHDHKLSKIQPMIALGDFGSFRDLLTHKIHPHTSTHFYKKELYALVPDELRLVLQGDLTRVLTAGEYSGGIPVLENLTSVYRINNGGIMRGVSTAVQVKSIASFWKNYEKYSAKKHSFWVRQIVRRRRVYFQSVSNSWEWRGGPFARRIKLSVILLLKCPLYLIKIILSR
jgi:glycosyltransferase involved in cell wall biosynthesis